VASHLTPVVIQGRPTTTCSDGAKLPEPKAKGVNLIR